MSISFLTPMYFFSPKYFNLCSAVCLHTYSKTLYINVELLFLFYNSGYSYGINALVCTYNFYNNS